MRTASLYDKRCTMRRSHSSLVNAAVVMANTCKMCATNTFFLKGHSTTGLDIGRLWAPFGKRSARSRVEPPRPTRTLLTWRLKERLSHREESDERRRIREWRSESDGDEVLKFKKNVVKDLKIQPCSLHFQVIPWFSKGAFHVFSKDTPCSLKAS